MLRKYFLAKLFIPLIKGSFCPQFFAIFGKLNFWRNIHRRGPYKNGEYLNYLKLCKEIIFLAKLFVPLIKGSVSPQFFAIFGKLNFWRNIDRRGPYKNGEFFFIFICAKKIFFGKIIYSTFQKKCFSTILGNFRKIEVLKENRQARTLQKWWIFELS